MQNICHNRHIQRIFYPLVAGNYYLDISFNYYYLFCVCGLILHRVPPLKWNTSSPRSMYSKFSDDLGSLFRAGHFKSLTSSHY